jgi:integrase
MWWSWRAPNEPRRDIQLRLLTAQRGAEILAMRWDQISNGWWTILAEIAKNGLAHRVALSGPMLALLEEIRPLGTGSKWVFPAADGDGHRVAVHKAHNRVRRRCGVDFFPHDLRRTAASHMTGLGISRPVVLENPEPRRGWRHQRL